jgi:16S rRNA (guanine966-N2)-methyltransferase
VRLIAGRWKRSKLTVVDSPGLRPTPDRVRETLFNWLGTNLQGWHVLDAFAGSGALGFEAASRGAARVVCIEHDTRVARQLLDLKARLEGAQALAIHTGDALAWMRRQPAHSFDAVMLDPPFAAGLHAPAIIAALPLLNGEGFLYVEADREIPPPDGMDPWRHMRAGQVHAHLWRKSQRDVSAEVLAAGGDKLA